MIYITGNSDTTQRIHTTVAGAVKMLTGGDTITHYLWELVEDATGKTYRFIPTVHVSNERYTSFDIAKTDTAGSEASSQVKLTNAGQYLLRIYGQTSSVNLDPTDSSVIGLLTIQVAVVNDEDVATIPSFTIPDSVIYYE